MSKVTKRFCALLLTLMLSLSLFVVPASATDVPVTDASFYNMSSVGSTFLSDMLAKNKLSDYAPSIDSANAGGLLGYPDLPDESDTIFGWIASALSHSSTTYSYAGLYNLKTGGETEGGGTASSSNSSLAFWEYAQYGRLLRMLGLDATGSDSSSLGKGLRFVSGWLMQFAYWAVEGINWAFVGAVELLDRLNPFKLFKPPEPSLATSGIAYAEDSGALGLEDAGKFMGQIYTFVWNNAGLILGFWLVIMAVTILLAPGGNQQGGSWPKIKQFLLRAFCLVLGIPLLAVTYTECLGLLKDDALFDTASDAASASVVEIFVDFENWASRFRLSTATAYGSVLEAEVSTIVGYSRTVVPTTETYVNLRNTTAAINKAYAGATSSSDITLNKVADSMLERYRNGTQYTASDYENYRKTSLDYDDLEELLEKSGTTVAAFRDNFADIFSGSGIWDDGRSGGILVRGTASDSYGVGDKLDYSQRGMLSSMAMYNYLSTKFDASNMIVYSNEKASSNFVRESHYSVNLIGGGISSLLYFLNVFIELIVIALIGWLWCLGMIINSIKRTIRMCMSLPGAMLGSIRSFAHIIVFTFMGIVEVVLTAVIFQIASAMLRGANGLINNWANAIVQAMENGVWTSIATPTTPTVLLSGNAVSAITGQTLVIIPLLISTIGMLCVGIMIFRLRGAALKSVDEMLTDTTNRLFGVTNTPNMGGGGGLGAALGAGAGAAVAQKLASGGGNGDSKNLEAANNQGSIGAGSSKDEDSQNELDTGEQAALESGDSAGGGDGDGGDSDVVNISDNDSASASFSDSGDDESAEMDAASQMNSLDGGDGQTGGEVESGADAAEQIDDMADEIKGEVESGDVEGAVDIAGGDSAADVQQQADMQAAGLREKAPGHSADKQSAESKQAQGDNGQIGQKKGEQTGKQDVKSGGKQSGEQTGKQDTKSAGGQSGDKRDPQSKSDVKQGDPAKTGGKTGSDSKTQGGQQNGQSTGGNAAKVGAASVAAANADGTKGVDASGKPDTSGSGGQQSGDGKDTHVDDRDSNVNAVLATDGKSGGQQGVGEAQNGQQNASGNNQSTGVPEGGASGTLSEAYSRNAEAKARLAELQAQQAAQGGQQGVGAGAGSQQPGGVSVDSKDGNVGAKQSADGRLAGQGTSGGRVDANGQPVQGGHGSQQQSGGSQNQQNVTGLGTEQRGGNVGAKQEAGVGSQQSGPASQSGGQLHTDKQQGNVGAQQQGQGNVSGQGQPQGAQQPVGTSQSGGQLHADKQQGNVGAQQQGQGSVSGQGQAPVGGATIQPEGVSGGNVGGRQSTTEPGSATPSGGQVYADGHGGNVGAQRGQDSQNQGQASVGGQNITPDGSQGQQGVGARQSGAPEKMGPSAPMGATQMGRNDMSSGGLSQEQSGGVGARQQAGGVEMQQSRETMSAGRVATGVADKDSVGGGVSDFRSVEREQSTLRTSGDAVQMDSSKQSVEASRFNGQVTSRDGKQSTAVQQTGVQMSREQSSMRIIPGGDGQSVQISRDGGGGFGASPAGQGGSVVSERQASEMSSKMTTTTTRHVSGGGQQPMSNKAVAGIAAQAAVAAFMANSDNNFVKGMGQYQMMGVAQQIYGGRRMAGGMELGEKGNGFVETTTTVTEEHQSRSYERTEQNMQAYQDSVKQQIDSLDADTAAIEAQIRALEQQRQTRPAAPSRQLGSKPDGADEYL